MQLAVPQPSGPGVPRRPSPLDGGPEARVVPQFLATRHESLEALATPGRGAVQLVAQQLQDATLEGHGGTIVDRLRRAQPARLRLESGRLDEPARARRALQLRNGGDVEVQLVPESTADRSVGTRLERLVEERGEQRKGRHPHPPELCDPGPESGEVAQVAHPPPAPRAQSIQRSEHAPGTSIRTRRAGPGRRRSVEQPAFRSQPLTLDGDAVVARRPGTGQVETSGREARASHPRALHERQVARSEDDATSLAALKLDVARETARARGRRQAQDDRDRPPLPCDGHRLESTKPAGPAVLRHRAAQVGGPFHGYAQTAKDSDDDLTRGPAPPAVDVRVAELHAVGPGEFSQDVQRFLPSTRSR